MARSYAQFAAIVFLAIGAGGFLTGDASHVANGQASGNFDGVALHLTYGRDVLDLVLAGAFAYAGWFADEPAAERLTLGIGCLLVLVAVIGFIVSDDDAGSRSILSLHFPLAINVFDLVSGVFAVLCGLSGIDQPASAKP
jgi:hypothetical protein